MVQVGGSVRCVAWSSEDELLVGGLDGQISQCKVGGVCQPLLQLEGSVICMKFNSQRATLAVGTSKGMLELYSCSLEGLKVVTKVLAHPPKVGPQDKRFGQLTKQAEVWSLCWSPSDDRVATCSEDQTTKIWDTSDWKNLTTLTGHSFAVTSVDWKDVGRGTLVATCSDDRTVRLTNGESYQLMRVLNTMDIYGWYTLTYLSFHPAKHSPLLLCTTQHGHVVVWDSLTAQRVTRGKMHLGSIEGLAWCEAGGAGEAGGGKVATVGADCVVNVFTVNC